MATSLKKLAAGIAAAAIAVSGFALGLGTANAANDAKGTITLTNNNGDAEAHTYTAYLVAPYNTGAYRPSTSNDKYVDIDTFGYGKVEPDVVDAVVTALNEAVTLTTPATPATVSKDLEELTGTTDTTPWGYKAGSSTKEAAERKFADALAKNDTFKDNAKKVELAAGIATSVNPAGLYLVLDTLTKGNSVNPASTQSVPMLVPSKIGNYEGLMPAKGDPIPVHGDIILKNTTVPVTKQVVKDDGTTPNNKPSYNIGDTVKFELTTTIPEYAGYDKDPDLGPNARVLKLIDTFQQNANNNNKIPFSNPTVESVKIKRLANGQMTDVADITSSDAENANYVFTKTKAADNTTVNGATIDFGRLVNGAADANTTWKTGDVITVVLTATLNKDAFVTDTANAAADTKTGCDANGNCNGVEVQFTNSQKHEESKVKGPDVNVYSFKFDILKKGKDTYKNALPNAQFTIRNSDNKYLALDTTTGYWSPLDGTPSATPINTGVDFDEATQNAKGVFATDSKGELHFNGLKADTYTVTEIAAPNGYYQNARPSFTVTITDEYTNDGTNTAAGTGKRSGDDWLNTLTYKFEETTPYKLVTSPTSGSQVTVDNVTSFTQLPKTGAAGIALFTVFGVAVLGAAGFFGLRARKAAKQIAQGA